MAMAKKRVLTPQQAAFVDAKSKGLSNRDSAIMADYNPESVNKLTSSETVKDELARIRKEARENVDVTKEDIANMFLEAANMAKIIGDVTGLVSAARELGKMLGFYS